MITQSHSPGSVARSQQVSILRISLMSRTMACLARLPSWLPLPVSNARALAAAGQPKLLLLARSGFTPALVDLAATRADNELIDLHGLCHGE